LAENCVVLIETAAIADLEYLRDLAFASANQPSMTRVIHWDEAEGADTAFYFEHWRAAFPFICACATLNLSYRAR
jgi:hypothetical protein